MRGYISPLSSEGRISLDSKTEIYRDPEHSRAVVAEQKGEKVRLGVSDVTVSRKKNGTAPVVLDPKDNFIEVHNNGNSNGVVIESSSGKQKVREGFVETVQTDTDLKIGYNTILCVIVETVSEVTNIEHAGEGDVVAGDKKVENVDKSTEVGQDAVVNRLNTHNTEESGSSEADTKSFCEKHEIAYEGEVCPKCAKER